ncbi:hypothetical protein BCF33_0734 [Hasllibacter halocynthiae]|uniref:Uncharacterized protein n=1 Tax=Hasllibacter halocynthiae TaxID=595589 RepID=A0A2T0X843_9RHOB|nr:hypothetical protein [Hasllibacter halocynthiae]PRY95120.1 hypothetical protein BCF33_0734 [Hasllibacter halocynthiae]
MIRAILLAALAPGVAAAEMYECDILIRTGEVGKPVRPIDEGVLTVAVDGLRGTLAYPGGMRIEGAVTRERGYFYVEGADPAGARHDFVLFQAGAIFNVQIVGPAGRRGLGGECRRADQPRT